MRSGRGHTPGEGLGRGQPEARVRGSPRTAPRPPGAPRRPSPRLAAGLGSSVAWRGVEAASTRRGLPGSRVGGLSHAGRCGRVGAREWFRGRSRAVGFLSGAGEGCPRRPARGCWDGAFPPGPGGGSAACPPAPAGVPAHRPSPRPGRVLLQGWREPGLPGDGRVRGRRPCPRLHQPWRPAGGVLPCLLSVRGGQVACLLSLCLHHSSLCLYCHVASPCVCVPVFTSPSYKDMSHWTRAHPGPV